MHRSRIKLNQKAIPTVTNASLVERLFHPQMIGVNYRYFESLAGIPRTSFGDTHVFDVGECLIDATVHADTIGSLRLELTPQCHVDLNSLLGNNDLPAQSTLTPAALANSTHRATLNYFADCLTSCGNAYDPSVYAHWTGSRADNYLEVLLEIPLVTEQAIEASNIWKNHMEYQKGSDYVLDTQFNCDPIFNDIAHSAFQSIPVKAVRIGYSLTAPITSHICH